MEVSGGVEATKKKARTRRTLLPWVGGKTRSADRIIKQFPEHRTYVELFCGGCAVLCRKPRSKVEVINDADNRLVTLLRVARYHPDALLAEMESLTHSCTEFRDALAQPGITDVQRAARFLMILKSAFGAKAKGPVFGYSVATPTSFSLDSCRTVIAMIRERLERVTVECLDFEDVIRRYDSPETLFYADPPYFTEAVYAMPFSDADHVRLRDALAGAQGKAVISLNDCARTCELYAGWRIDTIDVPYTVGRDKSSKPPAREAVIQRHEKSLKSYKHHTTN